MNTTIKLVSIGDLTQVQAKLLTRSVLKTASNPGEQAANVAQFPQELPIILAGPIVRRAELSQVKIWIAASVNVDMLCTLYKASTSTPVGNAKAERTRLGQNLFIYLATIPTALEPDVMITYNFDIKVADDPSIVGFEGDYIFKQDDLALPGFALPSFYVPASGREGARIAHGSCRKFHAPGANAIRYLEDELIATAKTKDRPYALHLTGDQIYADDVDPDIIEGIAHLGQVMLGWDERFPPDNKRIIEYTRGTRGFLLLHGFTADADVAGNHLLGFGDFAAMYVLAYSYEIWTWKGLRMPLSFTAKAMHHASAPTQRVLANIACYMICDDHEVTDDWNLNAKVMRDTANAVGRRLISNGLAAYWAFQAYGNDAGSRDGAVKSAVEAYLGGNGKSPGAFEQAMLNFHAWHFTAPTARPTIFLDTRTRRDFMMTVKDGVAFVPAYLNPPPGLLNDAAFDDFASSMQASGAPKDAPLIIVSPAPFFGYKNPEDGIGILAHIGSTSTPIDPAYEPEAWSYNAYAFAEFIKRLAQSGYSHFVILSGDVHYGFTAIASCTVMVGGQPKTIAVLQATSSALLNRPPVINAKWLGLKILNDDDGVYKMIGRPGSNKLGYSLEVRKVGDLGDLKAIAPGWDLQIRMKYLKTGSHHIVIENNVGIVVADKDSVSHTLLDGGTPNSASIRWDEILKQLPTPF